MHPEIGMLINAKADSESRELPAEDIHSIFKAEYLEKNNPLELISTIRPRILDRKKFAV